MSSWKNFSIWRGRLPHWRADNVTYFVTFNHRRPLVDDEMNLIFRNILHSDGSTFDFLAVCVVPNRSSMLMQLNSGAQDRHIELSKVVERAKAKSGRLIIKKTGERFPPFFEESFDRIVRDQSELEEKLEEMAAAVQTQEMESGNPHQFYYVNEDWITGSESELA